VTDFEQLAAPHRKARALPLPLRFAAAVGWTAAKLRQDLPCPEAIFQKLQKGERLSTAELALVRAAMTKGSRSRGRPRTPPKRNLDIRLLVQEVAREFQLPRTRSNVEKSHGGGHSAADAVAAALCRTGQAPRGFDRVRKVYARAKSEEEALVRESLPALRRLLGLDPETHRAVDLLTIDLLTIGTPPPWVE
jgi:hypothetical protein